MYEKLRVNPVIDKESKAVTIKGPEGSTTAPKVEFETADEVYGNVGDVSFDLAFSSNIGTD